MSNKFTVLRESVAMFAVDVLNAADLINISEHINSKIFNDEMCIALNPAAENACRMRCVMIKYKLIDPFGKLQLIGLTAFFPKITNLERALLIHYCYMQNGATCQQAFQLLECLYRAHAVKVLKQRNSYTKNATLPNPIMFEND